MTCSLGSAWLWDETRAIANIKTPHRNSLERLGVEHEPTTFWLHCVLHILHQSLQIPHLLICKLCVLSIWLTFPFRFTYAKSKMLKKTGGNSSPVLWLTGELDMHAHTQLQRQNMTMLTLSSRNSVYNQLICFFLHFPGNSGVHVLFSRRILNGASF